MATRWQPQVDNDGDSMKIIRDWFCWKKKKKES